MKGIYQPEDAFALVCQSTCESHVGNSAGFHFTQWNFVLNEGKQLAPFEHIVH